MLNGRYGSSGNSTCYQRLPEIKMTIARVDLKWFQFRQRIARHRYDQDVRIDRARERSISILQKRYGYDREKAITELDRHYSQAHLG
jgi:hypothetical protein